MQKSYFLLVLCCLCSIHLVAQQQELLLEDWGEPGELSNERDNVSNVQQPSTIEYVDTFGVFYVHEDNPNQIYTVQDSSLLNFHRYDPVQQGLFSYANTGILGSPARPLFYETRDRQGFDVGFHQFDAYYIQPTEVRFYILDKAYAKFRANIGNSQQDRMFTATFGRKFANGWQFSLEASSILEESGFKFPRQQLSDRALGVGLRYQSDNGRYQSFITLTSNTTVAQENGGIQILPERGVSFVSPANAQPILSNGANTRHAHRTLGYTQYLNLQGTEKGRNKRAFQLSHQLQYRSSTYKYAHQAAASDSIYYHSFLEERDQRGLRYFLKHQAICNTFKLGTYKNTEPKASAITKQRDRLEVGLIHRIHFLDNELEKNSLNNLFVTGDVDVRPNDRIALQLSGHLGILGNNLGDYRASGDLFFDIGKLGTLSAKAVLQAYEPSWIQEEFILIQQALWSDLNFNKIFENNLTASYALPNWNLSVFGGLHSITNYVYLEKVPVASDTIFQMQQSSGTLAIPQLGVQHAFQLGSLHFRNTLALQASAAERVLRLPTWLTRHSVYLENKLFDSALRFQLGIDLSMNAPYFADAYQTAIGQFHLQNEVEVPFYPALDAFINFQVKTVRVYVKAHNITHVLAERYYYNYYQTPNYPQLPYFLGFGLDWVMRN